MKKLLKSKQKGITLIALIITIIVLLILAGVALSAITGNESAINKATQARTENDQGAARDAASIMATGYIQEYMTKKYSQGDTSIGSQTAGQYVASQMNTKTSGEFTFTTNGSALTVSKGGKAIITGTIEDNGTITWDANINRNESGNGGNNGGSGNEQGNNNNQGGNETTTPNPGLSTEERALLASNNMAELTTSQIDADTNLTNEQKTALKDGNKVKAVLTGNVPVPLGYDYMEGTSTAANAAGENGWGVVIKDSNNNEWVWVPVNDTESIAPSGMFESISTNNTLGKIENNEIKVQVAKGVKVASIYGLQGLKVAESSSSSSSSSEDAQPISISYTINYYKDGVLEDSYSETLSDGDEVTEYDIDTLRYSGYEVVRTEPPLPTNISDGASINVYYEITEEERTRQEKERARQEDEAQAISTTVEIKSKGGIISGITRGNLTGGVNTYKEPALVTDYDLQEQNYSQAGFTSATQMAQAFKTDYENMVESITKYGGFYVGRYELSGTNNGNAQAITNAKVQKNQIQMTNINWYRLYQACRSFGTTTTTSTMIFGTQWDVMCLWAAGKGDQISYSQSQSNRHSDDYSALTGTNSNDIRNNIYDVEGSRYEWTQEAFGSGYRAIRGGYCFDTCDAGYRNYIYGYVTSYCNDLYCGSRPSLYIK